MKYRPYKKDLEYSYAIGTYAVIECLKNRPEAACAVFLSEKLKPDLRTKISQLASKDIVTIDDKTISRLSGNQGALAVGVFAKYITQLNPNTSHIILARPDDMGNLGTILRSMIGFGYSDLAIIKPSLDFFHPKVIRSSMGALFSCRITEFASLAAYQAAFPSHQTYAFTLDKTAQALSNCRFTPRHSLLFGNEGSGLLDNEISLAQPVYIEQTDQIDSLNLSVAVSLAMYQTRTNKHLPPFARL